MSARRPSREREDFVVPKKAFVGAKRKQANQLASAVLPIFDSGGMSYWYTDPAETFFPQEAGVQLLSNIYVPAGRQGFIKELRVAPYCPSVLCDPWTTSGAANSAASWREWFRVTAASETDVLPSMGDLWRSPMGWEAAWDEDTVGLPQWTWSLRFQQGNFTTLRSQGKNIPPFSPGDPASWWLVPNFAVPASTYAGGLPGTAAGPQWNAQRMQILPTDKISVHIPVPQDTTVMLFAQWSQSDVLPYAMDRNGGIAVTSTSNYNEGRIPPIGPSVGSLLGYTQSISSQAAADNLEFGWGG